MRRTDFIRGLMAGTSSLSVWAQPTPATDRGLVAWWRFESAIDGTVSDSISGTKDAIGGNVRFVEGVNGKAIGFDGFTTAITRRLAEAPELKGGFTVEAWIAPQEYSWNWTAIINQEQDHRCGYFFGLNYLGHIGLQVAIGGKWYSLVSKETVPLLKWSHVAGSFDSEGGLAIYMAGEQVGSLHVAGTMTPADRDLLLGVSHQRMAPALTEREPSRRVLANTRMVFDGLIDEVKVYSRPRNHQEIRQSFAAVRPAQPQPLRYRVLPSGPRELRRFGAFHANLKYAEEWDALWRGSGPDIIVGFEMAPIRLVCWRGASYAPCWVTENGNWFSNQFFERASAMGCNESMSDKQARYSSVRLIENTAARAVIHWCYSPVDIAYQSPFVDVESGWGDWAEEYYTVYPDGVAVRKATIWSSALPQRGGEPFLEWSQSLPILQPGQRPEDVLDGDNFVTVADPAGRTHTFHWPPGPGDTEAALPDANIQVVNFKSPFKPFLVLTVRHPRIWLARYEPRRAGEQVQGMSMPTNSKFWWWNHWPVAQLPSDGRIAEAPDRPSHSWTSTQDSEPYERTEKSLTQIMLCGLTEKGAADLVPLAKAWTNPPRLVLASKGFQGHGYDPTQGAYVITREEKASSAALQCTLNGSDESPIVNPALVVKDWGEVGLRLSIDGRKTDSGFGFRFGHVRRMEGTDLVVWLRVESKSPVKLELLPDTTQG